MEDSKEKNSNNFPNENEESPNNSDKKHPPKEKEIIIDSSQKSEEFTDKNCILEKNHLSEGDESTNFANQYEMFKIGENDTYLEIEQKKLLTGLLDELKVKNLLAAESIENYKAEMCFAGGDTEAEVCVFGEKLNATERIAIKRNPITLFNRYHFRELKMLLALNHPNIIPIKKVFFERYEEWAFTCNIVMPYIPHTLTSWLSNSTQHPSLPLPSTFNRSMEDVRLVLKQVLEAISYLHSKKLVHGDVKPANILIDDNNHVFLIDFGISKDMNSLSSFVGGTPGFAAPELLEGAQNREPVKSFITPKLDIFSFGVTLFKLFVMDSLYPDATLCTEESVQQRIETVFPDEPMMEMPEKGVKDLVRIIHSCIDTDPQKRPTAEELLLHPFFSASPFIFKEISFEKQLEMFEEMPFDNEVAIKTKKQIARIFKNYFGMKLTPSEKQGNVYKSYKFFHGGEAEVHVISMKKNGVSKKYAIRTPRCGFFVNEESRILKELKALTELDHPNIIKLERLFFSEPDQNSMQNIHEVMPFIEYDFMSWLVKDMDNRGYPFQAIGNSKRTFEEVRYVLKQALEGIQYMHNHNWLHLDMKFLNLLVDENSHCYISDLGFAKSLEQLSTTYPGRSDEYCSAEMKQGPPTSAEKHKLYTTREDIFSFGVMLYRLFVDHIEKELDVKERVTCETIKRNLKNLYQTTKIDDRIVQDLCDIIERCLNGKEAPSANELLEKHPFFSEQKKPQFVKDSKKANVQDYLPNIFDILKTCKHSNSDPQALFMAGVFYENGWGGAKDSKLAFQCFKQAADNGNADAQFKVGEIYGKGFFVQRDDEMAKKYFDLAAKQGHKDAVNQTLISNDEAPATFEKPLIRKILLSILLVFIVLSVQFWFPNFRGKRMI